MVKLYNDEYRLTTPKSGLPIDEIQDLSGVTEVRKDKPKKILKGVTVIGVKALRYNVICVSCNKSGVIATENNPREGRCMKCLTTSLMTMCTKEVSADLIVKVSTFQYELTALGKELAIVADVEMIDGLTEVELLMAERFDCEYNENMTIVTVTH